VASLTQDVLIFDSIPPSFGTTVANVNANCSDVPNPPTVCGFDNCPNITFEYFQNITGLNAAYPACADYLIQRFWVLTDACGNTNILTQNVTVSDTTPPVCDPFVPPRNLSCDELLNLTIPRPNCTDDCSEISYTLFNYTTPGPQDCNESFVIHNDWLVSDACGNFVFVNTTITILDTTPPAISNPVNVTINCTSDEIPNIDILVPVDNCGSVEVTQISVSALCFCSCFAFL
jgi:hypothetical protein